MLDFSKPVKYKEVVDKGDELLRFMVTNYNEVTKRCYVKHINGDMHMPSEMLVSINDLENCE